MAMTTMATTTNGDMHCLGKNVNASQQNLETAQWQGGVDGCLQLIDQTKLPLEFEHCRCSDVETVWEAIKSLRVRGAPAIGIAAAYGVLVGLQTVGDDEQAFFSRLTEVCDYLNSSRPPRSISPGRCSGCRAWRSGCGGSRMSRRFAKRCCRKRRRFTRKIVRCATRSAATGPRC